MEYFAKVLKKVQYLLLLSVLDCMKKVYWILSLAFLFAGCTSDYYYAASFLRKFERGTEAATEQIYVLLPKAVIHTNSTPYDSPSGEAETVIIDRIVDSIFLDQFGSTFLFTLSRANIPIVLVDDATKLPKADEQHFTVSFPQFEAEEYLQRTRSDFFTKSGTYYAYDYDLRHFSANVWLRLDAVDSNGAVVFHNCEIVDRFSGTVTALNDGKATLKTDFDRITLNDAYAAARKAGYDCAIFYIEKILAEYVCRTKGTNDSYFYYDPSYNYIDDVVPYDEGRKTAFQSIQ